MARAHVETGTRTWFVGRPEDGGRLREPQHLTQTQQRPSSGLGTGCQPSPHGPSTDRPVCVDSTGSHRERTAGGQRRAWAGRRRTREGAEGQTSSLRTGKSWGSGSGSHEALVTASRDQTSCSCQNRFPRGPGHRGAGGVAAARTFAGMSKGDGGAELSRLLIFCFSVSPFLSHTWLAPGGCLRHLTCQRLRTGTQPRITEAAGVWEGRGGEENNSYHNV